MATLRLFANLRESAGTDSVDIDASTVGELLATASGQFGDRFATGVKSAGVWVNGEQAEPSTAISASDEIALIPPVSGGATTAAEIVAVPGILSVALIAALLAVAWADPQWFVFVAVGAIIAWIWDAFETASVTRDSFVVYPPMIGATAAASAAYAWGFEGFAGGIALGFIVSVSWPIFDKAHREFRTTAATTLVTVLASSAAAGLVLIRLMGSYAVLAFVLVTAFALVGSFLAGAYGDTIQSVDPNVGALLGALIGGLIAGFAISELDIAAGLLGGVAAAAGVIGGRALGSTLRTGSIVHTENAPGALAMFDGAVLASPLFWMAVWFFG
ncbi:MAG: MoaD/ThiS family protein [Armatimonadetes bacterium]|nr:MAG: MoaD/ThiS family protein [Armatimonadota bacterium]